MLFSESDEPSLKRWLEKRLAKVSDADAPVLADYCIALMKPPEQTEQQTREICIDQLSDFLRGDTNAFVDDVLETIKARAFVKGGSSIVREPEQVAPKVSPQKINGIAQASAPQSVGATSNGHGPQFPPMPLPPKEMLMDPMFMMHMQQVAQSGSQAPRKRKHCFAFEQRGYCNKGTSCPYEHVPAVRPDRNLHEYDPNHSGMSINARSPAFVRSTYQNQVANNNTQTAATNKTTSETGRSTLIVENIPDEHMHDAPIRSYFSSFGAITSLGIRPPAKKAIVTFAESSAAEAAYADPSPIFNNRFVKLYWQKARPRPAAASTKASAPSSMQMDLDRDMIETRQRQHDERALKKQSLEERATQLAAQKAELERRQMESQAQLESLQGPQAHETAESARSAQLMAQLNALKAKASSLGLTAEDVSRGSSSTSFRGRGAIRGRGASRGRGAAAPYARRTLDLRPRTIRIVPRSGDASALEAEVRAGTDYETVRRDGGALQVTFKSRRDAELFSIRKIDGEMAWVKESDVSTVPTRLGDHDMQEDDDDDDENHNRYDD